jgi:hypothetical protein
LTIIPKELSTFVVVAGEYAGGFQISTPFKGSIVPVRSSPEDRDRTEAPAKAGQQTISAWIPRTVIGEPL